MARLSENSRLRFVGLAATTLLFFALSSFPQLAIASADKTVATDPTGTTVLKLSQAEALRQFEEVSEEEYTLGSGDEIEVQVPGQPDLQGAHVIGPDGMITLPLVGPIQVSGLTRDGAAQSIAKEWGHYYASINVTIQVTKYGSNRITVVGRVATPGPLYFETAPTLLEALAKSGAYGARPSNATLSNASGKAGTATPMISRCAVYRGSEQVLWVNLKDLFASGSGIDLHLRRDDVVFVPDEQEDMISILGQVEHPGAVRLGADTRVIDLLAMAGGLTSDAASNHIRWFRPSTGMAREVSLKDMLDPSRRHPDEIALQRGDVIYIPKSGIGKIGYVLDKFGPSGSLMMFGVTASGR